MITLIKDFARHGFDPDACRVWFATIFTGGITLTSLNAALTAIMLLSTIIYTWLRIVRKSHGEDE